MQKLFKKIGYDSRVHEIATKTENTKVKDISNLNKQTKKGLFHPLLWFG